MNKTILLIGILSLFSVLLQQHVKADDIEDISFDRNYLKAKIQYPTAVIVGKQFTMNFIINNLSSLDKYNVTISIQSTPDMMSLSGKEINIPRLSGYGSYATTVNFQVAPNATLGIQYVNLNFTDGSDDSFYNDALIVNITEKPHLDIEINSPSSIFANAEFPFQVTIEGLGTGIHNATIRITPPQDVIFRGETLQTFEDVDRNNPITMSARLVTPNTQVDIDHHIPFQVVIDYTDDSGDKKHQSTSTSIVLRPRSAFELGTEGGFWLGNTYFSPTVDSIGIVIAFGTPLVIHFYKKRKKKKLAIK